MTPGAATAQMDERGLQAALYLRQGRRRQAFFGAAAQAGLFLSQEDERRRDQGYMMMEALPGATFKMIQAQFVLEFAVVLLDAPARFGRRHQLGQSDSFLWQARQPIACGGGFPLSLLLEAAFIPNRHS